MLIGQQPGNEDRTEPDFGADGQVEDPGGDREHQPHRHQTGDRLIGQHRPKGPRRQKSVRHPQREHHEHEREQIQGGGVAERHRPQHPPRQPLSGDGPHSARLLGTLAHHRGTHTFTLFACRLNLFTDCLHPFTHR